MRKTVNCFLGILLVGGISCSKVKDNVQDNNNNVLTTSNSGIRLFNFSNGNLNLAVNNVQLTSFDPAGSGVGPASTGTEIGLKYFPAGVWKSGSDGSPFTVPNTLLSRKGEARIVIIPGKATSTDEVPGTVNLDTTMTDDPLHPKDYYILAGGNVITVPRTIEVPVQPDHLKIRVLNFSTPGDLLNMYGPATLTYCNGQAVDPALSNVAPGQASSYVEVPYGALEFKLFVSGDYSRQISESSGIPRFDGCHLTPGIQQGYESLIRTFKPGGTYAIVITRTNFVYGGCTPDSKYILSTNAFRIIAENSPPLNTSYARLQIVNALPAKTISLKLDGNVLGGSLAYAGKTDYSTVITTTHTIQAYDDKGGLLVQKDYSFAASDNVTAWVFEKDGKPEIVFMQNRMSFNHYLSNLPDSSDGTDGSIHTASYVYGWQSRFLNLSADIPSVTFSNDGQPFYIVLPSAGRDTLNLSESYQDLAPGAATLHDPYVIIPYTGYYLDNASGGFNLNPVIRAHRSDQQTPGPLLSNVEPLRFGDFITNRALFSMGYLPKGETGIYTVALVGRSNATVPGEQLKLLFIKHNQ
jgi:hypothetical protein